MNLADESRPGGGGFLFGRRSVLGPGETPGATRRSSLTIASGEFHGTAEAHAPMSAFRAWFYSVVALLGLVLAVQHLGVDVAGATATVVHGVERILNQPL